MVPHRAKHHIYIYIFLCNTFGATVLKDNELYHSQVAYRFSQLVLHFRQRINSRFFCLLFEVWLH